MKSCFELHHLSIGTAVTIERLSVTTKYTVDEFIAMTSAYPALIDALVRVVTDAPKGVASCRCDVSDPLNTSPKG